VLLCAFAGCLNPRPEEYPSGATTPGAETNAAPAADNPMRQGGDGFEDNVATGPSGVPDSAQPEPPMTPGFLVPESAADADAGADDAGVGDAGTPATSD